MKPLLNGLLLFILLYLLVDIFVKSQTLGISTSAIFTSLFGNADEFIDPMNKSVFLESLHMQIFFLMMVLLTLCAIFIRLLQQKKNIVLTMNLVMFFGLLTPVSLGIAYFYLPSFVPVYLACFFLWHLIALYMTLSSVWELNHAK